MEFLANLWLPIVVSAVFVFVASSVIHMALPYHKGDMRKIANEDRILEAMRANGVSPGDYMFPCAGSMKEMASPEMLAKYQQGPVGWMTVLPNGPWAMGRSLVQWFLYSLLISVLVAYIASLSVGDGSVFRITSSVAVLGYAFAYAPQSIWKGQSWAITAKFVFDGLVYGLVTGAAFAWLWPAA